MRRVAVWTLVRGGNRTLSDGGAGHSECCTVYDSLQLRFVVFTFEMKVWQRPRV
jgi:hypothetical protein